MTDRAFNFSAGPAILPESVLKLAQQAIWDLDETGIGVLEHSHRGAAFTHVLTDAAANIRVLAGVPDNYEVLFLQGGASSQFFMVPMNLLGGKTADYMDTGAWSTKAIKEAGRFGTVNVAASSKPQNYTEIPNSPAFSDSPAYVHFTSNNTIHGTQFASEPRAPSDAFLVCDASSDIFCRPIDIAKYGIVYAGAQKNLGPAGLTLVIIRKDLVERGEKELPTMLQYRTHAAKDSCFNTPPTFPIYVVGEVVKWLLGQGGLESIEDRNRAKADVIYNALDESAMFTATAKSGSRSLMNICFRASSEELEKKFIAEAASQGLMNLKGHRSVGGMRASVYNAFPTQGCAALVSFMHTFEKANS